MQPEIDQPLYGCVFSLTGREVSVIESLEAQNPGLRATSVSQVKWKSAQGIKSKVVQITMPGYVYFQTKSSDPPNLRYIEDAIRLLTTTKNSWALTGMDAWFARWVLDNNGLIASSRAVLNNNRVEFLAGPLYDLREYVTKVDKRSRNGQVALPFHDREVTIWLAYELVENEACLVCHHPDTQNV